MKARLQISLHLNVLFRNTANTHKSYKTNVIQKKILDFTQKDDDQSFEVWEQFNGLLFK